MPTTKTSNRKKAPPLMEIASIAEDSTGHLEVTREQHLRNIRRVATRRNSENGGGDGGGTGVYHDNSNHNSNRNRTQSSDAPHSNMKTRLATLTKLMRAKGNNNTQQKSSLSSSEQQQKGTQQNNQTRLVLNDNSNGDGRRRNYQASVSSSSQMAGDNGSVNSSVALDSIANVTEASLDTVKVSNMSEKQDSPGDGGPGSNNKKTSVGKQWNKFKRMMGVKTAPEESVLQQSTFAHGDAVVPMLSPYLARDRTNIDDMKSSNSRLSNASPWRRVRSDGSGVGASTAISGSRHTNSTTSYIPNEYRTLDSKSKSKVDDMIRGRLDGMDMLSVGGEELLAITKEPSKEQKSKTCNIDDFVLLPVQTCTFSGKSVMISNAEIVSGMIWSSCGGDSTPLIVLDGICPGPDGRWTVRLEPTAAQAEAITTQRQGRTSSGLDNRTTLDGSILRSSSFNNHQQQPASHWTATSSFAGRSSSPDPPTLQPSFASSSDGTGTTDHDCNDVPFVPNHVLQRQLWGPENGPMDLTNLPIDDHVNQSLFKKTNSNIGSKKKQQVDRDDSNSGCADDPLLNLAAKCSIPIDVDEDTFIISTRDHINSINEIASASLAKGHFTVALHVFETLLKGLNALKYTDSSKQSDKEEYDLRFSKGATMHNIGIVQMWLGKYNDALKSFENAVKERTDWLPKNHYDICVSTVRQAIASFALYRTEDAKILLEQALTMVPPTHHVRAKILNTLAVVYFRENNLTAALKEFTKSLEIQRAGLDVPVRRTTAVYDAAITLCNMGKLYLERSDFDLALYLFEEALLFQTSMFRQDHPVVLDTLKNLAVSKTRNGEIDSGLQILQGCLRCQTTKYGINSPFVIETIGLKGCLHVRNREYDDALQCFLQVRKWQKLNLLSAHVALKESKDLIRTLEAVGATSNSTNTTNNNTNGGGNTKTTTTTTNTNKNSSPKVWV